MKRHLALRGIPFDLATAFEWDSALIGEDLRKDYCERRFQALEGPSTEPRMYPIGSDPLAPETTVVRLTAETRIGEPRNAA